MTVRNMASDLRQSCSVLDPGGGGRRPWLAVSGQRKEERVDLTRFRSGHHPALMRWSVFAGLENDPKCILSGASEETAGTFGWTARRLSWIGGHRQWEDKWWSWYELRGWPMRC